MDEFLDSVIESKVCENEKYIEVLRFFVDLIRNLFLDVRSDNEVEKYYYKVSKDEGFLGGRSYSKVDID